MILTIGEGAGTLGGVEIVECWAKYQLGYRAHASNQEGLVAARHF